MSACAMYTCLQNLRHPISANIRLSQQRTQIRQKREKEPVDLRALSDVQLEAVTNKKTRLHFAAKKNYHRYPAVLLKAYNSPAQIAIQNIKLDDSSVLHLLTRARFQCTYKMRNLCTTFTDPFINWLTKFEFFLTLYFH